MSSPLPVLSTAPLTERPTMTTTSAPFQFPAYREIVDDVDENGDTDFIRSRHVPASYGAFVQNFAKSWPEEVMDTKLRGLKTAGFGKFGSVQATGALPPNLPVAPLATETVFGHKTHWLATHRFERLVIFDEVHGRVAISDILTEAQRIEALKVFASPLLVQPTNQSEATVRTVVHGASFQGRLFKIHQDTLAQLGQEHGLQGAFGFAAKDFIDGIWAKVSRAAFDDEDTLRIGMGSAFPPDPGVRGFSIYENYGITPMHALWKKTAKAVDKREFEPCISHFRRFELMGTQVLGTEQQANGSWSGTLYSEMRGQFNGQSHTGKTQQAVIDQLKTLGDGVLGILDMPSTKVRGGLSD